VIIFHDGWYYLLATDEACSAGATSSRDIRVGRSRNATGPFVDNLGIEMLPVGGELFGRLSGRHIGSDHFGLVGTT
jgi:arabinan endo-1,5-alpha-L-arabinosidase